MPQIELPQPGSRARYAPSRLRGRAPDCATRPRAASARRHHRDRAGRRSGCSRKSRGSPRSSRSTCCPTGRRCPTTASRRTRTWSPSASPRSTSSRSGAFDVVIVPVDHRAATASRRVAYLAALHVLLQAGRRARRRRAARAAGARRLHARARRSSRPGEYCVRGGLIDLFPMGSALPYRIDLFDDEIETHPHLRRRHAAHASTR